MAATYRTVSVRLNASASRRLERAAALMRQSRAAFLERAGDEAARRVLLDWTINRYRRGDQTFAALAEETGIPVEEIMTAAGEEGREGALEMFLASCKTIADTQGNRAFLQLAEEAVAALGARPTGDGGAVAPFSTSQTIRWQVDEARLTLASASDEQRGAVEAALAVFRDARPGSQGGSERLAGDLATEWAAGFLSRSTVEQFSKWCDTHSAYAKAQHKAERLSRALFGRVLRRMLQGESDHRTAIADEEWWSLGKR